MNFNTLEDALKQSGPTAAVDWLISDLAKQGNHSAAFYAKLMKARVALGVSPFPTGPSSELPSEVHEPYEEAIRVAARQTGAAYLAARDLPRAWGYYRLINEPQPVKEALQSFEPGPDDDLYPILDIAWYQRVQPRRGFELLLAHHGICSAITTLGSTDLSNDATLRIECIRMLVSALHAQLVERLKTDNTTLAEVIAGPELPAEVYHLDLSHLASVVQMSLELPPQDDSLTMALDLSRYGEKLDAGNRGHGDSPFENLYPDYTKFLAILAGDRSHIGHFEAKIESELADGNTFPAEVVVNLLVKLNDIPKAIAISRKYLVDTPPETQLSCPRLSELAKMAGNYSLLAETARANGDAVSFLAALIAEQSPKP